MTISPAVRGHVEPHVVEHERLARALQHPVDEWLAQLLRQRVEVADQADRPDEVAGLGGRRRLGLEPARHVVEPGALEPLGGLLGGGVVPGPAPVDEVARERLLPGGHLVRDAAERVDVALAAALGDQPAAGLQGAVQRGEQRVVVVDPVEGGVREDDVDRLGQRRARPGPGRARSPGRRAPPGCGGPSTGPRRRRRRSRAGPGRPARR